MTQTFMVTLEMEEGDNVTAREVEDALNCTYGTFSLDFNHDSIIVAKARKIKEKSK